MEGMQAAYNSYDHLSRKARENSVMSKANNESSSVIQSLIEQNKTQLDLI